MLLETNTAYVPKYGRLNQGELEIIVMAFVPKMYR